MRKDSLFLIGFMGSGKSTIGKILADQLNFPFLDLDQFMENTEKTSIPQIFEREGEEGFRALEAKYLRQVIEEFPGAVISTGGGTPCFQNNLELMLNSGLVIYLDVPEQILLGRLRTAAQSRPLLAGKSDEELKTFISSLLADRLPFYRRASLIIPMQKDKRTTVKYIEQKLNEEWV